MLHDTPCKRETFLWIDGVEVEFSLANEGTKVSLHVFRALLSLTI